MTRRTRLPTGDELRLWATVAGTARPLPGKRLPKLAEPEPATATAPVRVQPPTTPQSGKPSTEHRLGTAGLGRREARALARGRATPEGSIDLHGLSQAEAHAALIRFLRTSQAAGRSLVLVVTGKGQSSGRPLGLASNLASSLAERGVLRRVVPHWLGGPELRPIVVGFEEAGLRQGGAGALYVRLRRYRSSTFGA